MMSEAMHTALGAVVVFGSIVMLVRGVSRLVRRVQRFPGCAYLIKQARLDVKYGAEPMRIARGVVAAERRS